MSRGPGHVEQAIEAVFQAASSSTFSIEELALAAYVGVNRVEKKHRVAVIRAADKVGRRLHWIGQRQERPAGTIIYSNLLDARSYTLGRLRRGFLTGGRPTDELERRVDDPNAGDEHYGLAQPGGTYWLHVQINRAQIAGDVAAEAEHRAALDRRIAAMAARVHNRSAKFATR